MAVVFRVSDEPIGLIPAPLDVHVLHGWQLCPGDVLYSFPQPLASLKVMGGATAIPGADAVCQDTFNGAQVEFAKCPGDHVNPPQPAEEKGFLYCYFCDGVCAVGPGQVFADVNPEEPEAADSLHSSL